MNKELLTRLIYTKTRERYNEEVEEASLYQKTLQEVAKKRTRAKKSEREY